MFDLVADEVLDRGCDAAVLNATDVCDGQLSGQYRILREALEVPSPEGVAVQVHRWRRRTRQPFSRACRATIALARATTAGSQVAPSELADGMQTEGVMLTWPTVSPRAPFGPSVTLTEGMPTRGMFAVRQLSIPTVRAAFSSRLSALVSLANHATGWLWRSDQVLA